MAAGKETLLKRWAHAPWHSWLKDSPAWRSLLAELLARLPEPVLRRLFGSVRPLVVLPPAEMGRVVRMRGPLVAGVHLLQLDPRLLDRPRDEQLGILAHELAHLCVAATEDELTNDLEADRLARSWGFPRELLLALQRDLDGDHPRLIAAHADGAAPRPDA